MTKILSNRSHNNEINKLTRGWVRAAEICGRDSVVLFHTNLSLYGNCTEMNYIN